jgi:hypothetical protein
MAGEGSGSVKYRTCLIFEPDGPCQLTDSAHLPGAEKATRIREKSTANLFMTHHPFHIASIMLFSAKFRPQRTGYPIFISIFHLSGILKFFTDAPQMLSDNTGRIPAQSIAC